MYVCARALQQNTAAAPGAAIPNYPAARLSPYGLQHMSYSTPSLSTQPVPMATTTALDAAAAANRLSVLSESQLLCNVPEHHHMEDYLAELQAKNRELKSRLREKHQLQHDEETDRLRRLRERIEVISCLVV